MKHLGSGELDRSVIKAGLCIGCGACIGLCPYFRSYRGKTAMLFHCTLEEGRCFAYCPKVEVDLERLSSIPLQKDTTEPAWAHGGASIFPGPGQR